MARSTFRSQNVQNTPCTDHFWRFRCRKSACRCGAKHISKSKCTKHTMYGPFLEVQMSKRETERQKHSTTFNPSVGSLCHFCATPTHLSYRFSIFETSATALCGTTGIYICILSRSPRWTLKIEKMHARTMLVGPYFCQFWWFERPRWLHFGFGHPNKKHHLQRPC